METIVRRCKQCQANIDPLKGRRDRKFCDEHCKNKYHNTQIYLEQQEIKRVQQILKKNRRILKKMFSRSHKDAITRERLLKDGFEFDYHTHFITTKIRGNQFTFCFDYGYRMADNNNYAVIKAFDHKAD